MANIMWLLVSLLHVFGHCDPIDYRTRTEFDSRQFAECSFDAPRRRRSAEEDDFFRIRFWRIDPLLGSNITFTEVVGEGENDIIRPFSLSLSAAQLLPQFCSVFRSFYAFIVAGGKNRREEALRQRLTKT